jgi:RNA polymerase sigma-70 factor (ECF subfamily)
MPQYFMTTPWSLVLKAADRSLPECDRALATLCEVYWYPIYAFVRRQGRSPHEAEDCTQEFFARMLEKDYLEGVGKEKGKFRSFLLVCVKRFLANEHDRASAKKRGGGKTILSIDFRGAEDRYRLEPAHELTAERIFERRWALTLLETALAELERDLARSGRQHIFDGLKVYLVATHHAPPYAETAAAMGMTEGAVKVAVFRLRQRYQQLLRAEVARTLDDPADVDHEIRQLFEALGR